MVKKTGLGKGLDALFSSTPLDDEEEVKVEEIKDSEKIHQLKITEIEPNKEQQEEHSTMKVLMSLLKQ